MQTAISGEGWLHIAQIVGLAFISWIVLRIDNSNKQSTIDRLEMKEELVNSQNAMREDMDDKHAENKRIMDVHAESDKQQFDAFSRTVQRIDRTLDKILERQGKP